MSGPPEGWRSGKATRAYFAEQGIEVHLSTITRQRAKYPKLFEKHGRVVYIDAVALLAMYKSDYRAAMHAGELGGDKVSRLDAKPDVPDAVRAAAPKPETGEESPASPAEKSENEADRFREPVDPTKRKAWHQANKLAREAAEAEGLLIPAVSAHAAITFAIAEAKTVGQAAIVPAAERIAAMFRDDARALEVRAILEDVYRSMWNTFAAAAGREMTNANPAALEDFRKLEVFADELRAARGGIASSPDEQAQAAVG